MASTLPNVEDEGPSSGGGAMSVSHRRTPTSGFSHVLKAPMGGRGAAPTSSKKKPAPDSSSSIVPLSKELRTKVHRLQDAERRRNDLPDQQLLLHQKRDSARAPCVETQQSQSTNFQQQSLEPPRQFSELGPMRLLAPPATSSTWSGGERLLNAIAQGPHHFDFSLHDDDEDDNDDVDLGRPRSMLDGTGTTWPPVSAYQGGHSTSWWSTVRQIHELSVLELERQIGLPRSLSSRSSLNTEGSTSSPRRAEDGPLGFDIDNSGAIRNTRSQGVDIHGQQISDIRTSDRVSSPAQGDLNDVDLGSDRTNPSSRDLLTETTSSQSGEWDQAGESTTETTDEDLAVATSGGTSGRTIPAADAFLFDTLFNLHPFAAAAFLRAFIACSFGLTLFHVHTFMSWPDHAYSTGTGGLDDIARKWLLAQIIILFIQIPLRMEVQRSLFCVSTSQDTAEATRRLQTIFLSSAWQANRNFGRITIGLMCCGPILLRGSNFWWAAPSDTTGETDGLRNIQIQIISINSSNLLIFMMRIALVLSLLYFVQVAQPMHNVENQKRGLTEGTIRRLRRITYHSTQSISESLTQCAVCLEHYDNGAQLIVLPCDPRHNFHVNCIEPWLKRMNRCPLCQRGVPEEK